MEELKKDDLLSEIKQLQERIDGDPTAQRMLSLLETSKMRLNGIPDISESGHCHCLSYHLSWHYEPPRMDSSGLLPSVVNKAGPRDDFGMVQQALDKQKSELQSRFILEHVKLQTKVDEFEELLQRGKEGKLSESLDHIFQDSNGKLDSAKRERKHFTFLLTITNN
ncbi:hypothetical protein HAX54_022293 [Datura stramonium]|uniref:Uncharacterized protein n=1 Tax=Datura stramonium TaxID=4076 RepID=A0ABS8S492_DATST|nr:hypothetical protein [Datura stramonium]